jgi:Spy/CpxP family protein refolding chaperone
MLHGLLARIDATPAQERAIVHEVERLQDRLRATKASLRETRGDLGAALRGPVLDDAALGAVLGRVDGATAEARAAIVDGLRNVHGLLDERQRAQLADLLEHLSSWRGGGGGPYRM